MTCGKTLKTLTQREQLGFEEFGHTHQEIISSKKNANVIAIIV